MPHVRNRALSVSEQDRRSALLLCASLLFCGFLGMLGPPSAFGSEEPQLGTLQQLNRLSRQEALKGHSVGLNAVVVYSDKNSPDIYFQDETDTAKASSAQVGTNLVVGQYVELTGNTSFSEGRPALTKLVVRVLGSRNLPAAKRVELPRLAGETGQWIEIVGIVRLAETNQGRLNLLLQDQGQSCRVSIASVSEIIDLKWLAGAKVRVRGVNAGKLAQGPLEPPSVLSPALREMVMLEPASTNRTQVPVASVAGLLSRRPGAWTNSPVHLSGLLSSYKPGEFVVIKDPTGSMRAQVNQIAALRADERVEVWGFFESRPAEALLRDAYLAISPQATVQSGPGPAGGAVESKVSHIKELTQVGDILKLSPEDAAWHIPVRLRGTVTYADPESHKGFFQDQSGAVSVVFAQANVRAGSWVELAGQTSAGEFAPAVRSASVSNVKSTGLPVPVRVDLEDLADGSLEGHWVEVEGVVRRVNIEFGHLNLTVMTRKGRFKAILPGYKAGMPLPQLVDALVAIHGACSSELNGRRQVSGITLHVPWLEQVGILEAAPADPFAVEATPIASVATFQPQRVAGKRVRVSGVVTLSIAGREFFIQDSSGGIRVRTQETEPLRVGDQADVLGFPATGDFAPSLEEAIFRKRGSGPLPEPKMTTAEQILLRGTNDGMLVQMEAELLQTAQWSPHPKLVLRQGPVTFTAQFETQMPDRKFPEMQAGSVLRLTGVCSIQGGEHHEAETFHLLLSRATDFELLCAPPWWTLRHTVIVAGALTLGIVAALVLAGSLRRQVRRQTGVIRQKLEERNKFADSLLVSEERFRSVWERSIDGMRLTEREGKIVAVNEAYCKLVALPREKLLGRHFSASYKDQGAEAIELGRERFDAGTIVPRFATRARLVNAREVDLEVANSFIELGEHGRLVLSIFRDITERKGLEQQLRQAQKMEAIGQLAAGVAHDFNNLLAIIRGNADLVLMKPKWGTGQAGDCIKQIVAASERAADLTRQLLAFSRKQVMQPRPIKLNDVVHTLSKMLKRIIGENVQLECAYGAHLPLVQGDAGMIEQVVVNLVVNARDAMPKGGRLHVTTETVRFEAAQVQNHPEARAGEFVCLAVSDTGTGISPELLPRIFEPFFTTKELGKGTGLGLATVYGIVKQHEGWIEISSKVGEGSRFSVYLPAGSHGPASEAEAPDETKPRGGAERILLVEDDEGVRQSTRRMLESFGYCVSEADSGRAALERWRSEAPEIDLLLTDIVMPHGVTGTELAEKLREEQPELKVIFMTGYSDQVIGGETEFVRRARGRVLQKPCSWRDLIQNVRQSLDEN